jgi:hypothetical protein
MGRSLTVTLSFEDCRSAKALAHATTALEAFACKGKLGTARDAAFVKASLATCAATVRDVLTGADMEGLHPDDIARRDRLLTLLARARPAAPVSLQ